MTTDDDDDYGPHLNTSEDPYLARRAAEAEAERTRQLAALDQMTATPRARALARARQDAR